MSNTTQLLNSIPAGTIITLTGTLKFSRLTRNLDGEALQKDIERRKARGERYITMKPHTSVTICDVTYEAHQDNPVIDQFLAAKVYQSKSDGYTGYCFGIDNTGSLPWIGTRQPDGHVKQIGLSNELANDQRVTLVLNVFKSRNFNNNGLGLQGVIVESPTPAYFDGGLTDRLKAAGVIFDQAIVPQVSLNTPAETEPEAETPMQPLNQPVTPPAAGTNAYSSQPQNVKPQQTMPYQQNQQNQQTQPQATFPYPPQPTAGTQTAQQATQPTGTLPGMNPPIQGGSEDAIGIRYDASDRQYH